jgi:hypothetical protein
MLGRGTLHAGWRAVDADTNTAWCQAAVDDAGSGALVVRFAQPVTVRSLEVHGAGDHRPPDDAVPRAPRALTVTSDAGAVTVSFDAWADDPASIALPVGVTRSLSFRLGPRPAGMRTLRDTCLSEIHIQLVDQALVYGAPPEALTALPLALTTLDGALRRCDRKQLARLADFPIGFREIAMPGHRAYATEVGSHTDPRLPPPRDLPCRWTIFHSDDNADAGSRQTAELDGAIAPGVVRVEGGVASTAVYWELAWRARRWQLVSFDTVFFE